MDKRFEHTQASRVAHRQQARQHRLTVVAMVLADPSLNLLLKAETFEDKSLESAQEKSSEFSQEKSLESSQDKFLEQENPPPFPTL